MRLTIDASVHLKPLNPHEEGSSRSQQLISAIHGDSAVVSPYEVFVPMLLLVEVAASTARIFDDSDRGLDAAEAVRQLPRQTWIPLDESLTTEAAQLATTQRLRGADSIYGAVAQRYQTALVTLDHEQLNRLDSALSVCKPVKALEMIASAIRAIPEIATDTSATDTAKSISDSKEGSSETQKVMPPSD